MTTSAVHELVHVCLSICTCLFLWLVELEAKCKNIQDEIIKRNNGTHYNRPPKKSLKNKTKREKHARKIPSSLGLFIEDSSCFFVSGPGVKTKRGEREKTKFKKILLR